MILEPLDGPAAIILEGVVHVVHTLGDVDVIPHPAAVGRSHPVKGFVGDGKERVTAEHGLEHTRGVPLTVVDEVLVFLNRLEGFLLTVPVADLVAQACPHTELPCDFRDLHQRARDLTEGGVVVEDGGDALLDGVNHQSLGAGAGGLQVQIPVDIPPLAVQHLVEVGGVVAVDGEAPGQGGVNMGVGVDKSRHDDAAPGIYKFRLGIFGLQVRGGAYLHNGSAVGGHAAVREVSHAAGVPGDNSAVCQ